MIKPKRVRKKHELINMLYIDYEGIYNLPPNACVGVNRIYFNTLANYAMQNRITDEHFWNIIRKYDKFDRYSYKLRYHTNCSKFHIMSLRDIYYLINITKLKPYRITTFIKVNINEEQLEEKHRQLTEEYNEKREGVKTKIKTPEV